MDKMILTAGPSITHKEIDYVTDAIMYGHEEHYNDYVKRFEKAFAEYIGVKHALATSSCTGAMHLALTALGIGKGDEVIVPDCSWIATASAVVYTGAKPVFADILSDSWCIDPDSIEGLINYDTKAIIPVHLYGHPCEMNRLIDIAREYDIKIVEDAAPSVGAEYLNKKTGSFGDIGCFSFQGAKILSTEEGGMLVTNNTELFEKVKHYSEHGRSGSGFDISDIGFKYKMTNLQAAMGLGQLERINELVEKKRLIYSWYRECLKDVDSVSLNKQSSKVEKSNYWMTSIVLDSDLEITRDEVIAKLKKKCIDSRPFFPPMSSFPMFNYYDNPVAICIGANGINLPSAHNRTEEEIVYICNCIKDILHLK